MQRKFTRKRKRPVTPPTPVVRFADYTTAMTPLERYRKHYLIFDYWNSDLIDAFAEKPISAKRVKRTSAEALQALEVLKRLLNDEAAERLEPIIAARTRLNERVQSGQYFPGEGSAIRRTLERQRRQIHREFFWREVEDRLRRDHPDDAQGR